MSAPTIDWDLATRIGGPAIGAITGFLLTRWFEKRPKLISFLQDASAFTVEAKDGHDGFKIHTHSIVVRNAGKKPALNVRVSHNQLPDFQVFPSVPFQIEKLQNGVIDLVFPKLIPSEQITISYLYFPPIIWSNIQGQVRSDEGFAKIVTALPTPQLSPWKHGLMTALLWFGGFSVIYFIIAAIRSLCYRT